MSFFSYETQKNKKFSDTSQTFTQTRLSNRQFIEHEILWQKLHNMPLSTYDVSFFLIIPFQENKEAYMKVIIYKVQMRCLFTKIA